MRLTAPAEATTSLLLGVLVKMWMLFLGRGEQRGGRVVRKLNRLLVDYSLWHRLSHQPQMIIDKLRIRQFHIAHSGTGARTCSIARA